MVRHDDGSIQSHVNFNGGKLDGHAVFYSDKGILEAEGEYLHGKRHGQWRIFDEAHSEYVLLHYEKGRLVD